ncbi:MULTISPECIES: helix-turn-helix domain-containing protein [Roseovarius]|uniref:helix-turn-helix domain-containing protein n=1 Tax=Roseovarius TaxID=74030 RepID=UPI00273D4655|nr:MULTISPECIES: helix-turn-helix domain-containing protein [unclassified Roseovarius]
MPDSPHLSASGENTTPGAQKFRKVSEIARLIHESHDLHDVLRRLTEGVCMHSNWSTSTIQALDLKREMTMPIVRYDPFRPQAVATMREWEAGGSPLVRIVETGKPLVMPDASEQDGYPNFRDDARHRGYRTVVLIPLKFPDSEGRAIVFSVYAYEVVEVDQTEMGFLQCLADLADLAVRRMQALEKETAEAHSLREVLGNLTDALASTLNLEKSEDFVRVLSRLFPGMWFAVDLTSGRPIMDKDLDWPPLDMNQRNLLGEIVRQTLRAESSNGGETVPLRLGNGPPRDVRVRGLDIDGSRVGALFLIDSGELTPQQEIVVQAGQFALSTMMLRNYVAFRIRGHAAQRLLKRLFSGELTNQEELLEEAAMLDFSLDGTMRLLAIRCPGRDPLEDGAYSFVIRKVQETFGQSVSCGFDGAIYFLLHDLPDVEEKKFRDGFMAQVRPALPPDAAITLSDPIPELIQIPHAQEVCHRNLTLAERMKARGWITAQNIGALNTLMTSLSEATAENFLAKTIEPIAENGSSKGQTALNTLDVFLNSGRRLQESADELKIHVSTMRYRLERLAEKHNIDLSDSGQCFELELALRLYKLRKSYRT